MIELKTMEVKYVYIDFFLDNKVFVVFYTLVFVSIGIWHWVLHPQDCLHGEDCNLYDTMVHANVCNVFIDDANSRWWMIGIQ